MELVLPTNLKIRKGFKRYKCVVRNPATKEIINYLEGNANFYSLFQGETFYNKGDRIYCTFINKEDELEDLSIRDVDISEYDLLLLSKTLEVIKPIRNKEFTDRKRPQNWKPFDGVSFETNRKGLSKWKATVKLEDGTYKALGYFQTAQEARTAQATFYTQHGL